MLAASGATNGQAGPFFGSQSGVTADQAFYMEAFLSMDSLPVDALGTRFTHSCNPSNQFNGDVRMLPSGVIQLREPIGATVVAATSDPGQNGTTFAYTPGQSLRFQWGIPVYSATLGVLQMRLLNAVTGAVINSWTSAANLNTFNLGGASRFSVGIQRNGIFNYATRIKYVATRKLAYPVCAG
jgi:hypothetical protein